MLYFMTLTMSQRITVMLDDPLIKKLRNIQATQIKKTKKGISFSKVLNQELKRRIKKNVKQ